MNDDTQFWAQVEPTPDATFTREMGVLTVRLRPDLLASVEVWVRYRPDLDEDQKERLAAECRRRVKSLMDEGRRDRYQWQDGPDGLLQAALEEV